MSEGFIKFMRSKKAEYLLNKYPKAFVLLTHIVVRARRDDANPDGLKKGEAFVGDYKALGFKTRGEYRHSLGILVKLTTIKIIETCRNRKKATTGTTTTGTKVKLISSDIYDLNLDDNNHRNDHPTTTEQPPNNHELRNKEVEEREEEKKVEKEKPVKKKRPDYVASADALRLTNDFLKSIKNFKSNFIDPTNAKLITWHKEMDKLLKLRTPEQISSIINWIPGGWWEGKILSVSGLTKHMDTLELQMEKQTKKGSNEATQKPPEGSDKPKPRRANELVF